jgi:predicted nucleic acid-binding protein
VNIFVETNFVLEVALEQEESLSCEAFLRMAASGAIRLLLPAYSLIEPHETLTRRRLDRTALHSRFSSELTQLSRSSALADRAVAARELATLLTDSAAHEAKRLGEVKARLCGVGDVLPLDREVLQSAIDCQTEFELPPQDAIVYASIRARLKIDHASASCFVSRNPRDFDNITVGRDLAAFNCKYFSSFLTALRYVEHALGLQPGQ